MLCLRLLLLLHQRLMLLHAGGRPLLFYGKALRCWWLDHTLRLLLLQAAASS